MKEIALLYTSLHLISSITDYETVLLEFDIDTDKYLITVNKRPDKFLKLTVNDKVFKTEVIYYLDKLDDILHLTF